MFGYEEAYHAGTLTRWQKLKPKIWALFDEPYSSSSAKVPPVNVQHRNVNIHFFTNTSNSLAWLRSLFVLVKCYCCWYKAIGDKSIRTKTPCGSVKNSICLGT